MVRINLPLVFSSYFSCAALGHVLAQTHIPRPYKLDAGWRHNYFIKYLCTFSGFIIQTCFMVLNMEMVLNILLMIVIPVLYDTLAWGLKNHLLLALLRWNIKSIQLYLRKQMKALPWAVCWAGAWEPLGWSISFN